MFNVILVIFDQLGHGANRIRVCAAARQEQRWYSNAVNGRASGRVFTFLDGGFAIDAVARHSLNRCPIEAKQLDFCFFECVLDRARWSHPRLDDGIKLLALPEIPQSFLQIVGDVATPPLPTGDLFPPPSCRLDQHPISSLSASAFHPSPTAA